MTLLWQVVGFVVAVSLLVSVHEFGHYYAARKLGFKVLRFSVGFGPALWRRVAGPDRTEYVLAALPLGGYVKLLDEREGPVPDAELSRSFTRRPPWQRIVVLIAGPLANFVFAILILWGMLWFTGAPELRPVVGRIVPDSIVARAGLRYEDEITGIDGRSVTNHSDVIFGLIDAMSDDGVADIVVDRKGSRFDLQIKVPDAAVRRSLTEPSALMPGLGFRFWSPPMPAVIGRLVEGGPAARAGLQAGDRITAVDGETVTDFPALAELIADRPNRDVRIDFERAGVAKQVAVHTQAELVQGRERGRMRIETPPPPAWPENMVRQRSFGFLEAASVSVMRAWDMSVMQARMLARMVVGQMSIKNLSGPLAIAEYAGQSASSGLNEFLGFLVVISLSLGFLNLLPIPILDGGQIVYQIAEWIKGSPLSDAVQAIGQQVGLVLLLLLMGVALFNDVARQFG